MDEARGQERPWPQWKRTLVIGLASVALWGVNAYVKSYNRSYESRRLDPLLAFAASPTVSPSTPVGIACEHLLHVLHRTATVVDYAVRTRRLATGEGIRFADRSKLAEADVAADAAREALGYAQDAQQAFAQFSGADRATTRCEGERFVEALRALGFTVK